MRKIRKRFDEGFKVKVALEAVKSEKTQSEIASHFGVHPNQVTQWKKRFLDEIPHVFGKKVDRNQQSQDELIDELYRQIGQLKVELDWVKKNLAVPREEKRTRICGPCGSSTRNTRGIPITGRGA